MFRALALSIGQLGDPAFLKVLAKSLALTLLAFLLIGAAAAGVVIGLFGRLGWFDGYVNDTLTAIALTLLFGGIALFALFRAVATAIVALFSDEIVEAVERKHYPHKAAAALNPSLREQAMAGLASVGRAIGWNIAALPLYLVLLFTGIGFFIALFAVNALLLARDLGDMIALRHVPRPQRRDWLRSTRGRRMQAGLVSAALFVIPVVNLLAPILGAAMAAHLLHGKGKIDA